MKIKKEYIILAVIIAGLLLYLSQRKTDRTLYQLPTVPEISKSDIIKIDISKNNAPIAISKEGDRWTIGPKKYPADTLKVKNMLDVMNKLTLTALVSESKSYNRYNLDDDNKITVKAFDKDKLKLEFDIGKAAPSFRHTFVKIAGDNRVFHARGSFREKFDKIVDDLRDKTVLAFNLSEINEIYITNGNKEISFSRTKSSVEVKESKETDTSNPKSQQTEMTWQNASGQKGDNSKINRLLTTLSDLSCEKYLSGQSKDELLNSVFTLLLKGTREYKLSIFAKPDKADENYPAISSENSYPFILSDSQVKSIMEDPGEMLEKKDKK